MTVLVFGRSGQVATEVARRAGEEILCLGREQADLSDPEACAALVRQTGADAVINAAAWTAVDRAETEEEAARVVNAVAPTAMARAAAERGLPFVHLSTDYVFDGAGDAPFPPDHPTAPLGAYGRTKLEGEEGVRAAGGVHAILRTSWVVSAHGTNFVKTMLRLGAERERLAIVADQIGGPTPAGAIAQACLEIARQLRTDPAKSGTYHFSGAPETSWADLARETFARAGLSAKVEDIPSSAYPTPARRPLNSRLDCSATEAVFGLRRPDWRVGLGQILEELGASRT